jgi:hypothetical protein
MCNLSLIMTLTQCRYSPGRRRAHSLRDCPRFQIKGLLGFGFQTSHLASSPRCSQPTLILLLRIVGAISAFRSAFALTAHP